MGVKIGMYPNIGPQHRIVDLPVGLVGAPGIKWGGNCPLDAQVIPLNDHPYHYPALASPDQGLGDRFRFQFLHRHIQSLFSTVDKADDYILQVIRRPQLGWSHVQLDVPLFDTHNRLPVVNCKT